jgi:hypothetical protein
LSDYYIVHASHIMMRVPFSSEPMVLRCYWCELRTDTQLEALTLPCGEA